MHIFIGANSQSINFHTIDVGNVDEILPTLPAADNIKTKIANAAYQNQAVTIPDQEIAYQDWTGRLPAPQIFILYKMHPM